MIGTPLAKALKRDMNPLTKTLTQMIAAPLRNALTSDVNPLKQPQTKTGTP